MPNQARKDRAGPAWHKKQAIKKEIRRKLLTTVNELDCAVCGIFKIYMYF